MHTHRLINTSPSAERLTLSTEELAGRWGIHPESLKRAVRSCSSPVRPIIPGAGRWVFSLAAVEQVERATADV
jgi:hypothetical protein